MRIAASAFVVFMATAVGLHAQELAPGTAQGWQIAGAFPKSQPGPLERDAKPITPENPIPRRTRTVRPSYPPEAAAVGVRASVTLRVTLDHLGTVREARSTGAPILGAIPPETLADDGAFRAGLLALLESAKDTVGQWLYEPPADAPIAFDVVIAFTSDALGDIIAQSAGPPSVRESSVPQPTDRGYGNVPGPRKVKHVAPVYPAEAREKKITGVVILEARVEADGRILEARVLRSIPELDQAALDAVKQWEFTPTLINGVAMPVTMTTTIQFSLQ